MNKPDIITFIRDSQLIDSDLSPWQETGLRLFYGLVLNDEQRSVAQKALGTDELSEKVFREGVWICGRRSGKSERIAANIAVFEATFGGHEKYLSPGERAHIVLLAQDTRAGKVL